LRPQLDHDARFAAAIKNRPVILGYYFSSKEGGVSSGAAPEPVFPAGTFSGRRISFTQWVSFGGNLPEFQKAAAGAGHFNPLVDIDGTSRRVPLLVEYKGLTTNPSRWRWCAICSAIHRSLRVIPETRRRPMRRWSGWTSKRPEAAPCASRWTKTRQR
jgi:hypothetical protein